jgi:hypothetical protein
MATTALIIGAVVAVVAAGVGAYAAHEQAQAQKEATDYNAKVARNQALLAQYAADQRAKQAADRHRRLLSAQRVAAGVSGITTEGSPLAVMMDTAAEAAYQENLIRYGGQQQSEGFLAEASLQGFYGQQALKTGQINVGRSLLSGASGVAGAYGQYQQQNSLGGSMPTQAAG